MHPEAHAWVKRHAPKAARVLDIGGRDINGNVRDLFPGAEYVSLDIAPGPNVDIVADASTWTPDQEYDVVVCCEVFEHTEAWPGICQTAFKACTPGGWFIATMAGPGRPVHSAVDGGWRLHEGEHYENVQPARLRVVLEDCGWAGIVVDRQERPADVRCVARKP